VTNVMLSRDFSITPLSESHCKMSINSSDPMRKQKKLVDKLACHGAG
jgi:hypothetical protein